LRELRTEKPDLVHYISAQYK